MASIGKMALSVATGVQETTLALANFNFDFAMIKMEAPPEYHGLGNRLSKRRKLEAEEGHVHTTARQLGALFADDVPAIPNLARVYGLRASEVAADPLINPTGTALDGPLASHVGLDGTSIWAAATSGRGGLQVHLLACILARVWSSPEAVSIWSELVSGRKAQLEERLKGDQFHMGHLMASRIDIGLQKLAEWDTSARAWLRAADKAKFPQQKQLMLIIDNIDLQVRSFPRAYDSVIDVWTKSLTAMENLVSGVAQSLESPEMLLGLTSWHLYPDLAILADTNKHVLQRDELVPKGGLVTIGLHGSKARDKSGITWTMPLAQMRYYGNPIHSTRSIGTKSLRVSFNDIVYIAMGSAISNWTSYGSDLESVCKFWIKLAARCDMEVLDLEDTPLAWLRLFSEKANLFLISKEAEKKDVTRFVNLGRGRYRRFLGFANEHPGPAFGLGNITTFLTVLDVNDQIRVLRELVENYDLGTDLRGAMIFYRPSPATSHAEFATLYCQKLGTSQAELHRRWITGIKKAPVGASTAHRVKLRDTQSHPSDDIDDSQPRLDVEKMIKRAIEIMQSTREPCGILPSGTVTDRSGKDVEDHWKIQFSEHSTFLHWKHHSGSILDFEGLQRYCSKKGLRPEVIRQLMLGWEMGSAKHIYENVKFTRLFGTTSVLVYRPIDSMSNWKGTSNPPLLPLDFLSNVLESLPKEETRMVEYLGLEAPAEKQTLPRVPLEFPLYLRSLEILHRASLVYSQMPSATIDPAIATYPLHSAKWAGFGSINPKIYTTIPTSKLSDKHSQENDLSNLPEELKKRSRAFIPSRPVALALIASFDSGGLQLDPQDFQDVIAVSSGNSLYVSEALLNDPTSIYHEVRCLVGNVGKPGMALLLSPRDPIVKTNNAEVWEMINHEEFDGRWEDNFKSTSLHLKLTGYEMPINAGQHGSRYQEVLYAEAIVSAHARGQWVADINVLSLYTLDSERGWWALTWLEQRLLPASCHHDDMSRNDHSDFGLLTSIDNWPELLDRPPNTSIIRAKGNWDARLALSAVMRMKNEDVIIASGDVCWACIKAAAGALNLDLEQLLIIC